MSFSPLPAPFLEFLSRCDHPQARALDLGCGEAVSWAAAAPSALSIVALDRRGPAAGSGAGLVGDALRPPLRPASFDLVVASNLFRHILEAAAPIDPLPPWQDLLRPGGALFLFEDEPGDRTPAERNYAALQSLLARLVPESRGSLLAQESFLAARDRAGDRDRWRSGVERNGERADVEAVLAWLKTGAVQAGGEVGRLVDRIERHGLDYGHYWWAMWTRPEAKE